jgi:hypothetical protein
MRTPTGLERGSESGHRTRTRTARRLRLRRPSSLPHLRARGQHRERTSAVRGQESAVLAMATTTRITTTTTTTPTTARPNGSPSARAIGRRTPRACSAASLGRKFRLHLRRRPRCHRSCLVGSGAVGGARRRHRSCLVGSGVGSGLVLVWGGSARRVRRGDARGRGRGHLQEEGRVRPWVWGRSRRRICSLLLPTSLHKTPPPGRAQAQVQAEEQDSRRTRTGAKSTRRSSRRCRRRVRRIRRRVVMRGVRAITVRSMEMGRGQEGVRERVVEGVGQRMHRRRGAR